MIALILYAVKVGQGDGPDQPGPPPPSSSTGGATGPVVPPTSDKPRLKVAWITEDGVVARQQAGLNMAEVKTMSRWEEVRWLGESDNWDQVALEDGTQAWVESRYLTFTRPANLKTPSAAEEKVMNFYENVSRRDFSSAYTHLSPDWKRELSYAQFTDGYSKTTRLRSEIINVVELGEDRFQVDVSMVADEGGKDVPYLGVYTVERVKGLWVLTSGRLKKKVVNSAPEETF